MTTACTDLTTIQHRASVPANRFGLRALIGTAAAMLGVRHIARLPVEALDDHMLRDIGIDGPAPASDPRDLILRL
ncbi:MAG: hypothetical protein JF625_26905 [Inquilinus limosus]|jgi:uncharacterized protein YjiS (DUF1127 family)|uniref:DUF1127 domain-containing protein n=1 Tax=Inquilinus limosus TaxID=171674 RepID=A0A952FUT4_9PROT|nr:hypothetical protein [Inquilinus limosus]